MAKTKWEIRIDFGASYTDNHYLVVDAVSLVEAILLAENWAKDNRIEHPKLHTPYRVDDTEDLSDEWFGEEEEFD